MKTSFGDLAIAYTNPLSKKVNGFHISPRLQELMILYGERDCYAEAPEMLGQTLGISVSTSQVYRVTDTYGSELKEREEDKRLLPLLTKDEILYMEFDGSFIFSREEGWKEVKVGRLFKSTDCIRSDEKRSWIRNSQYLAHLSDHQTFIGHADKLIESFGSVGNRLVCISDGAPWIRNWVEDSYPNALSILDYYHACEYLYEFANATFETEAKVKKWVQRQKELLLESKLHWVIRNITNQNSTPASTKKIVDYYTANQNRMDYKRYLKIGCGIIGSGAIESAHRTVVQKRLKLSGQRWTKTGAQNMLQLRVTKMNKQWGEVVNLVQTEFKIAA
ncbi:MAG: UPF0236 family protein [Chloroflexi bacterium]|nr:UPF0236 family protein [Chloroflexota bacterium]